MSAWTLHTFGSWPAQFGRTSGRGNQDFSIYLALETAALTDRGPASPPVQTLGLTEPGRYQDQQDSNCLNAVSILTGPLGGVTQSISVFVPGPIDAPPNDQFSVAIYADAGGTPTTRLAESANTVLGHTGWNSAPISTSLQPRTRYWLVYNTNGLHSWANNLAYNPQDPSALDRLIRVPRSGFLVRAGRLLSDAAGPVGAAVATIAIMLWFARRSLLWAAAAGAAFAVGLLTELLMKRWLFYPLTDAGSYPSGHALRAALVCLMLALWLPRTWQRAGLVTVLILVSLSRVYLGEHYWYEVAGGLLAGSGLAVAISAWQPERRTATTSADSGAHESGVRAWLHTRS